MATAKMKIIIPLVVWITWLHTTTGQSFGGIGFGIRREVFFLNLEDGYFGCQVNESTDVLQLFELSKLCDGTPNCFLGSDELTKELKCTDNCRKNDHCQKDGCQNGACLDSQCHCNDGYGGCSCEVPDENECKYRPCDVFAHCTNTLGSFHCTCFPGYQGDGFHCEDINECDDPAIAARCVENSECCNLPAHFLCKCLPGYEGDGEVQCVDIDECRNPNACGTNAICQNTPGNYTCVCPEGFHGNPYSGCIDFDECQHPHACGPGAICQNVVGGRECYCPPGYEGDAYTTGCGDMDECSRSQPCGRNALCSNLDGSFKCTCPPGFIGNPLTECTDIQCRSHDECHINLACINRKCQNPCAVSNPCTQSQDCKVQEHQPVCVKVCQCQRNEDCGNINFQCDGCQCVPGEPRIPLCSHCPPGVSCDPVTGACLEERPTPVPKSCKSDMDCLESEACYMSQCRNPCEFTNACAETAICQTKMHRPICSCPTGYEGNPATNCFKTPTMTCTRNEECPLTEACIGNSCQRPCDVKNPCAQHAVCINTNHGCDCSCEEGYHGNGYVECQYVENYKPICQYNEDCPPNKLCDRLNRICINPCDEESCGENAECLPKDHGIECRCLPGFDGNPYTECYATIGCRADSECPTHEACINGLCTSPCKCGFNAVCDVLYHVPTCKCPPGYQGDALVACQPPRNPCEPNPCGLNALCELDEGNPICFCPKGLTGNPFKNCIPEGDECSPNPCGPNSGCRVVGGNAVCFCLPEYEGTPPHIPCSLPINPCDPSPCGPNTQCAVLSNGFAKCTCLPGYIENINTIRGCVEAKNPCEPNPCGHGAYCDPLRDPICFCPVGTNGNPYRNCIEPKINLCSPGPCGANADCYITNDEEQCFCRQGFIGNPYTGCRLQPATPCVPNPCGPGAQCTVTPEGNSLCKCPEGFGGDPIGPGGCHGYECVVDDNCPNNKACIGYKCKDPCPGACGIHASCKVERHHPVCACEYGLTGNPVIRCYELPLPLPENPCLPSPCGINTLCQNLNGRAVCSCLPDFVGDPTFGCQPECVLNSDCPLNKACLNRHCIDPCAAGHLCGVHASCQVRDHTATCVCPQGFMGDPFFQCIPTPIISIPSYPNVTVHPCTPSPCGNMECSIWGTEIAICDPCLGPEAPYNPQCRPECLTNADCPFDRACLGYTCTDPCPGSCGVNALCSVVLHTPICSCPQGLVGDPFQHCSVPLSPQPHVQTCETVMCGENAECNQIHNALSCTCKPGFYGNPLIACRPECVVNPDCLLSKACINNKCVDPCAGVCGVGAQCDVVNHVPICACPPHFTGDPFVSCYEFKPSVEPLPGPNPCDPSPCGPFSRCLISHQGFATCSCLPNYYGVPPVCKPECIVSSECPQTYACVNQKCVNPCTGTCGANALCTVINHNPICSCAPGQQGDPFVGCYTPPTTDKPKTNENPCVPSPCGPNSICQVKENHPVCSCIANYIGSPPYCRPECTISQECPRDKACVREKCVDPCVELCGRNAKCDVVNHNPFCSCKPGYEGDAFISCSRIPPVIRPVDPCNPSPCAENSQCTVQDNIARCTCIPPYIGNAYVGGCRPECTMNSECASHLACLSQHCRDPCQGLCGINAECSVVNHVPVCACGRGLIGDPFTACRQKPVEVNPCEPSPCGPNSVCRMKNEQAICSCQVGYFGVPPACRPECLVTSECTSDKACINQKCQDPCVGTCGIAARCQVHNHNPICSCPPNHYGDPFIQCTKIVKPSITPCIPSPCGANAECRTIDNRASCSCLPDMYGVPPNCRPECLIDQDCPLSLACVGQKCKDPCTGSCGFNAQCNVVNHRPICSCLPGFEGDPFSGCNVEAATERTPPPTPCTPSPCGPNAECREKNGAGACLCLPGFHGDPYESTRGCHRECEVNDDCKSHLACIAFKCVDPCPGTCGTLAECRVNNHIPTCTCLPGFTGDAFFQCKEVRIIPPENKNPCQPTPCGPNSQCRELNQQAVCSCLPNYIGSPPECRPECVVSSECQLDKACINQKCSDPCPNTCGLGAQCTTRNHNPICACPPGYTGDPFLRCIPQPIPVEPVTERPASCYPSPCGPNSQCRIQENTPICSCLPDYLGSPPECRPECVISTECESQHACINQKCRDPCPGSCGVNAQCHVINHLPICTCAEGHTGDPFTQCNLIPRQTEKPRPLDPCNPSPCGPNAECNNGICICLSEYIGNPYESCRPECVLSSECPRDKACIKNKCRDPCPGTCGQNARCDVINHIPACSCPDTLTGDPFTLCRTIDEIKPRKDTCSPSPCGQNSQCKIINEVAVCSCLQGYQGTPPSCRPECIVSSECPSNRACVNQKCIDPCPGSCGLNAACEVRNYSPICSCREGYTGDPFQSCRVIIIEPTPPTPIDPCRPSPCGPNSICRATGDSPSCSCAQGYIGTPPNCRPECVINPDCPSTQACINNKCKDPCPGSCGVNAECVVIAHTVSCNCITGFTGNPFLQCLPQPEEKPNPCEPSPCGPNAECRQRNGAGSCVCIQDYFGNPYEGCKPECVLSSDCATNRACIRNKCVDPCPGVCGQNAECSAINHVPTCTCIDNFVGDPFVNCHPAPTPPEPTETEQPCSPSPCGPNSQCREVNHQAVCSCLPDFIGSPPNCKPECVVSSECPQDRACHKFKCANPCTGSCGISANCQVINHAPICSCKAGFTGDPFTRCYEIPPTPPKPKPVENPCIQSPCGPNSECRVVNEQASCSCLPNYFGSPPNCRPECLVNTDCASNLACITEKCRDPCIGSCGFNAECRVQNHIPICSCLPDYTGDSFSECTRIVLTPKPKPADPCNPSPCGQNAECNNGICTCVTLYRGDPYLGCRPECTMNSDCSPRQACSNLKCIDPCPGTCGQNAVCDIVNHIPTCSCPPGQEGDPFVQCRTKRIEVPINPCQPSPCGPNSVCRVNNGVAVCSCQPGLIGSPPSCRPECVISAECPLNQACLNQKCVDPCPGTCGISAKCQVINHNPICSCIQGNTGDPFVRCYPEQKEKPVPLNPCDPSPCGPNSVCQVRGESPACSCLENYIGSAPNCRPECTINPECSRTLACINQKCRDPCPGSCGSNALCSVINHNPTCTCVNGFTGDPFQGCVPAPAPDPTPSPKPDNPCVPSPCGPNAQCRLSAGYGVCECLPEYQGNPYEGCRPECISNSECPMNRACIGNKCRDPCPGTCGISAECDTVNHVPICSCPNGYTGDAFRQCIREIEQPPRNPCNPSPCGINTICRESGQNAICECLPGFFGTPTAGGCRPECTISADCDRNRACVNQKCVDPCPGTCGFAAVCNVINHSPVCSCPPPLIGDPFTLCREAPKEITKDPCNPSPCNINGECRVINGVATCSYPECIINQDCPRDKACYSQKCGDPCRGACGINALCQVVNHRAICSCPIGYIGSPEVQCLVEDQPKPKVECTQDSDCTNDKACLNSRCVSPCTTSLCGNNAECRVQLHRAICTCRDGFTGNAQQACYEIGCRSDSECPPTQSCVNKECVEPCSFTSCGLNALCKADYNHKARCYCPNNFRGDPFVRCERPECTRDEECSYNLACRNERCSDPCNCGNGAICRVTNHRPQCSCPPGYIGNPLVACTVIPEPEPECRADADCPRNLACFSGICKNPCFETNPCGRNTECIVVDSLPLRTMSCMCLPGYVGNADTECRRQPTPEPGCKSSAECPSTDACINRQCVNPCALGNPCALNAECTPTNHKAVCRCPPPLLGDPLIKCYPQPQTKPECQSDNECTNDKSCINQRCQNPCELSNPCSALAECRTLFHRPTCSCPLGWLGNPQVSCYKPECTSNSDCPYDKACISEYCQNPCASQSCGRGAECAVQRHIPQCQCPLGTQGNPLVSCITGICHYNEDCADHEACDRLNRVCRPVCDEDTCADNAQCIGQQHQPKCTCPLGTTGNPFVKCIGILPPEPECKSDSECLSHLACINNRCMNPCSTENVCTADQECLVLDTLPLRTIMCQCPPDTIVDASGKCVRLISPKPQCIVDSECSDSDRCIAGTCIEACRVDRCGINAICTSRNHQAICTCPPGYIGNAHYECNSMPKKPIPSKGPECYRDSDCSYDRTCRNEECINICIEDNPCASSAFCSARNHQAECRCPEGYEGNPKISCIPPLGPTVGCTSNSDCPKSESCINRICASPCNCGPNAECRVLDHYPTCLCRSGYSGNPQLGCFKLGCQSDNECSNDQQCYNGQCISPCILGNPCARNAECYGNNHRAQCRCLPGFEGNPVTRCERIECRVDNDCPNNRACYQQRCVDPCSAVAEPPCAQNAICYVTNHLAGCYCPPNLPEGNPLSYCIPRQVKEQPECEFDNDCPSKLACIGRQCVNPCEELSPCHRTAQCSVSDTVPVRTMICTCPEGWVPNENGECHPVIVPIPPGCTSDNDCSDNEACINRLCTSPCECGTNADCRIQNHRAVCSCREGYEGNPNLVCHTVGCRVDSECGSGKACINGNCINPCLIRDNCGINAECYAHQNRAECRCRSGYRGNPLERCIVIGCLSNSDCPGDRQCINAQCINPCIYDNPCSPRAECIIHNHLAVCRCPPGLIGNPYFDCKPGPRPECREDSECPSRLACLSNRCQDPCAVLEPCRRPAECQVIGTVPLRTMNCVCLPGYISSGSGTCNPVKAVIVVGACASDSECPSDKACFNGICRNPCNCGPYSECRIKDHKPVCTCEPGYDGNPELECHKIGCRADSECSPQHTCVNRQCIPVCAADGSSCGDKAICYGYNHRAVCDCPIGLSGNPRISCNMIGCRTDTDCPSSRACINSRCELTCEVANPCDPKSLAECKVYNHVVECVCPPGTISDGNRGCLTIEEKCRVDSDCPLQFACIGFKCINPCVATEPCGINAECTVLNTEPVRTMVCICLPGYQGNAAKICNPIAVCREDKGYIQTPDGRCVCAPNLALNENDECVPCPIEKGLKIDERGRCVCALERGLIIDERGNCVCPIEFGYHFDEKGNCVPDPGPECETDNDCADHKCCNQRIKTCEDCCMLKHCGEHAYCNATNHVGRCHCIKGYTGNPDVLCNQTSYYKKQDFPKPDLTVNCLSDGIQVEIRLTEVGFNGILYVKGHSKDEKCRRVVTIETGERVEYFKVHFGECGLIHVNGEASFVLVIQKHPKLVTYKAQAYHIKCVYHTGEQNVTLGFNVSMLTTAGTIANTGPPPTCLMKIVTPTGEEINSAEIGDNLMLQVDVQPGSIYGGFARSCVAKTMEDAVENEYIVTDENGCATDPSIFGEWDYNPDTQSLLASFNAFKFPSSDNIRFQCNIRVCFGRCQPVNCRGYNAFGRRKRSVENSENDTDVAVGGDLLSGQLREEITIQSNAILTFEKREERYPDPQTAPNAQRAEDICVSMIGFIIALIITALLALVAVAVAVSCWLMAYRRRPKHSGPLPHPPEFPNPLFTTPEPMAEPSPDYLT